MCCTKLGFVCVTLKNQSKKLQGLVYSSNLSQADGARLMAV